MKRQRWQLRTVVAQTTVICVSLALVWGLALLFAATQVTQIALRDLIQPLATWIADELVADDTSADFDDVFDVALVVDAHGTPIAGTSVAPIDLGPLSSAAPATGPVALGAAVGLPVDGDRWLVVTLQQSWVWARVGEMALPIAALCLLGAALIYPGARLLSVRATRKAYLGLEPHQVSSLRDEHLQVLESMSDGALAIEGQARVLWLNPTARALLDVEGPPDREIGVEDLPEGVRDLAVADAGHEQAVVVGDRILMISANTEFQGTEGPIRILVMRDRTEQLRLLRELDGAVSHAQELRSRTHEFDNTLHIINGLLELGRVGEALEFIGAGGVRGEFGTVPSRIEDEYVSALLLALRASALDKQVTVEIDGAAHLSDLADDPETRQAIMTIIGNLVRNAIEACGANDVVRVQCVQDEHGVTIAVDDSGAGIELGPGADVFDYGTSSKGPSGVRGIGLHLVRAATAETGGTVTATASSLGGARFEATIGLVHGAERGSR